MNAILKQLDIENKTDIDMYILSSVSLRTNPFCLAMELVRVTAFTMPWGRFGTHSKSHGHILKESSRR